MLGVVGGAVLTHSVLLSNTPGLYSLDATSILPLVTTKNASKYYQMTREISPTPPLWSTVLHNKLFWFFLQCFSILWSQNKCFFVCLFVFKLTLALWILQVKLLVPKKMSSMGNRELEIGRYSIHYFDYFSFPLILVLSPSSKEHSLKYTKQYLVLLFIISVDWQAWSLLFTHLIRANSFCLLIWICSIDFPHVLKQGSIFKKKTKKPRNLPLKVYRFQ